MTLSTKIFPSNKQCSRSTRPRNLAPMGGADEAEKYNSVLITITYNTTVNRKIAKLSTFLVLRPFMSYFTTPTSFHWVCMIVPVSPTGKLRQR